MSNKGKTAIICAGGGMKSAHSAGFLYAMATSLGITSPDIIIGSSGGAGSTLYYTARQYDTMKYVWEELLASHRFISLARFWRVLNVDYLIDTIFKEKAPLDLPQLYDSSSRWIIPVTDASSGQSYYFDADNTRDPYEVLRATKAIPLLYRKSVRIGERSYIDGELGTTIDDHVRIALSHGASKILILSSGHAFLASHPIVRELYIRSAPRGARAAIRRDFAKPFVCPILPSTEVVCVAPVNLPVGIATRDAWKLRATFERGVSDALSMEEKLRTLFA